ncbi:isopropylmalate synthase [Solibacillus sp. MA9]|uniref:Isopropylmalate synthase n=1 Tax=Solibacillus palustris TaxID=2908203 RepID=A0ABS9U9V0_9BACL|nr:isopropylmalate synthase [Solibacillus sp. MA9]MCH7321110.1 isopropylmalate synthase [Solibacillus sp. MA9]
MKNLELLNKLHQMSDEQLQQFAQKKDIELTLEEIKKLRKIMKHANISWAITGIPNEVLQKLHKLLGEKRYKKLMRLVGI